MENLIEDFVNDHKILIEALNEVKQLGIAKKEGQEKLLSIKNAFINHLKKEDLKLYPALHSAASKDEKLKKKLEMFAKDMDEISKGVMTFFSTYSSDKYDNHEFAKDFGKIYSTLKNRVYKEENILYPEYDKI